MVDSSPNPVVVASIRERLAGPTQFERYMTDVWYFHEVNLVGHLCSWAGDWLGRYGPEADHTMSSTDRCS